MLGVGTEASVDLWEGKSVAECEVGQLSSRGVPFQCKPRNYQVRVFCERGRKLGELILVETFPTLPCTVDCCKE